MTEKNLTDAQLKIISDMYMEDQEVRDFIKAKFTQRLEAAKAIMSDLSGLDEHKAKPGRKLGSKAKPGDKGHKDKILTALKAKPGMKVGELREMLAKKGHEIDNRSLNTLLYVMTQKGELKHTGEKFSHQYFAA